MMENGCDEFVPGEGRDDGDGEVRIKMGDCDVH